jgi:FO synthase
VKAAGAARDAVKGRTVSYSRKVFIPLTNLCRDKCGYCTFAKAPRHPEAKTMTPDEVVAVARAGAAAGCKEALFSLGEKPEERYAGARSELRRLGYTSTIDYLAAMCALVHRETGLIPHANCGVLERDEILALREVNGSMGLMLESSSDRLLGRGQAHFGCVGKVPATRLETMALAGELQIPFTTGILIGIGETPEERVDSLFAIREIQEAYGHIQEVIIQNFRVKPDIRMRGWPEPGALDMVRTIAVARLVLGPSMNIQAPPNLTSDAHGMYLEAGINDWGGVSPVTKDHINPERPWPAVESLADLTARAGFTLRERLCIYPDYVRQEPFVRQAFREQVRAWTGQDGHVRDRSLASSVATRTMAAAPPR